jgi:ABC-2 type transport system permease protein
MSVRTPGAFLAIYRLVLKHQLTKGRLALFGAVAAVSIGIAWLASRNDDVGSADNIKGAAEFVDIFGLGLVAPVIGLVLGSAALGTWRDDETMVYVWLRPVSRGIIGLAATMAAFTVTLPAAVLPMTIAAGVGTSWDGDLVAASAVSMSLATAAYTSLFVLLGLVIKRALIWGLVYVFIWEFFIARGASGAARLSINNYAKNALSDASGLSEEMMDGFVLVDVSTTTSYLVPILVAAAAVGLTTARLRTTEVA